MWGRGATAPCAGAFIELAERLADRVRIIVTGYFRTGFEVVEKADLTPVTVADREAEAAMRAAICEAFPEHGIVGEEFGAERAEAEHVWVLDPVDGTKRFVTGNPQFGTLIALLRGGRPILGVIDMPCLEERWVGAAGRPTIHRDRAGSREVRVRPCAALSAAALYATSPQMFEGPDFDAFERLRRALRMTLYGGECYAYGLLASGFVDLVVEADMAPYDYLPLVAVVEGAGGRITDWRGRPLGLQSDGRVLAAGDPGLHQAAQRLLARP